MGTIALVMAGLIFALLGLAAAGTAGTVLLGAARTVSPDLGRATGSGTGDAGTKALVSAAAVLFVIGLIAFGLQLVVAAD